MSLLNVALVLPPLALAAAAPPGVPGPEQARRAMMCGTWDVEMTLWPRPGGPRILQIAS